jgi:dTDP-4-dehydrorhamnose 3,5-epimerase
MFARLFCDDALGELLGDRRIRDINLSRCSAEGTLRGLHYQTGSGADMKLVRCTAGSVFDVVVDMRPDSPTYLRWHGEVLSPGNLRMVVVPEYFAHGYQALEPGSELLYAVTAKYTPDKERGVRWDDPAVSIDWPLAVTLVSGKDGTIPLLSPPLVRKP